MVGRHRREVIPDPLEHGLALLDAREAGRMLLGERLLAGAVELQEGLCEAWAAGQPGERVSHARGDIMSPQARTHRSG